jgi:hypothetical protein
MGQKIGPRKGKVLFSRRVELDISKTMFEIRELRELVRSAEMAATNKRIAARPKTETRTRTE